MNSLIRICFFFLIASSLYSQTCCSGGVPVSSNLGFNQSDKGVVQLSLSFDFNRLSTLYDGSTSLDDELRIRTTQSYIFRTAYNISDVFGVEAFIPFVRQTRNIITNSGADDFASTTGIGDPILLAFYDVLKGPTNIRLAAGPQIPLGSTSETNDRGLTLLEDLQPGSGAWDLISMFSLDYQFLSRPTLTGYFNGIYSWTSENGSSRNGLQAYEFGNDIQLIVGLSDQLLLFNRIVNPGLSFRYRNVQRDRINQIEGSGTGGNWVFARASIGVEFIKQSLLSINYEIPLHTFVNETQLSPDRIINISLYKTFKTIKNNTDNLIKL